MAKERVKTRVEKGGHGIPDEVIDRRYSKSLQNLEVLIPLFDSVELFDNTDEFQTIYKRNKFKISTSGMSIEWARPSIKADKHAIKVKQLILYHQQLKKSKRND